jgi:excisionase family DNA binding protein
MEGNRTYLTLREASERLGVHPNTLRNWERRGVIRLERLPGSRYRRVPVYELQRLGRELERQSSLADAEEPPSADWSVRIDWPTQDPEAIARGEVLSHQIQDKLANVETQETLEEVMSGLRGYAWLS